MPKNKHKAEGKGSPRGRGDGSPGRAGTRVPQVPSAARKVSNEKRDDRDKRRRQVARKRMLLFVVLLALVTGSIWGLLLLSEAPLFTVDNVEVTGTRQLTQAHVVALASISPDTTLLRLPEEEIANRILRSPWVAGVEMSRHFPHTLAIAITERTPSALVDTGAGGQWLVSTDGHWICKRSRTPTGTMVPVRDAPNMHPAAGSAVASAELRNALRVIAGISTHMRDLTAAVSAPSVEKTALHLKNDVQVFVGSSEDIKKKDLVARGILDSQEDVVYINVRAMPPTVRGLSPAP